MTRAEEKVGKLINRIESMMNGSQSPVEQVFREQKDVVLDMQRQQWRAHEMNNGDSFGPLSDFYAGLKGVGPGTLADMRLTGGLDDSLVLEVDHEQVTIKGTVSYLPDIIDVLETRGMQEEEHLFGLNDKHQALLKQKLAPLIREKIRETVRAK
jgi:hypothetical protein